MDDGDDSDPHQGGGDGVSLTFVEVSGDAEGYVSMHDTGRLDEPTFVTLGDRGSAVVDMDRDPVLVHSTLGEDDPLEAALRSAGADQALDPSDYVTPDDDDVWNGVMGHMTL